MVKKCNFHNISIFLLNCFLVLLPIDAALGDLISSISIINYFGFAYIFFRLITIIFVNKKISLINLRKNYFMIFYLLYFCFSVIFKQGDNINLFLYGSLLLSSFICILAIIDEYSSKDIKKIKKAILFGTFSVAFAYIFLSTTEHYRLVFNSARSMDPNFLAGGMCLLVGTLFSNSLNGKHRFLSSIGLLFILYIIALTGSRSGLIANFAVMLTLFIFNCNISISKKIIYSVFILFIFVLVLMNIDRIVPSSVIQRFSLDYLHNDSGAGRFDIWKKCLAFYKDNGLFREIFGTGAATFQYLIPYNNHAAHNIYLQTLIEGGVVNFIILVLFLYNIFICNLRNKNYIVFSTFVGCCVCGLGIDINISRFFWICIFLSLCSFNISKIEEENYVAKDKD